MRDVRSEIALYWESARERENETDVVEREISPYDDHHSSVCVYAHFANRRKRARSWRAAEINRLFGNQIVKIHISVKLSCVRGAFVFFTSTKSTSGLNLLFFFAQPDSKKFIRHLTENLFISTDKIFVSIRVNVFFFFSVNDINSTEQSSKFFFSSFFVAQEYRFLLTNSIFNEKKRLLIPRDNKTYSIIINNIKLPLLNISTLARKTDTYFTDLSSLFVHRTAIRVTAKTMRLYKYVYGSDLLSREKKEDKKRIYIIYRSANRQIHVTAICKEKKRREYRNM